MKKKVVPKLRQEVKIKVDIVTSDDIKIYYTGKFQDFTARYIIRMDPVPMTIINLRKEYWLSRGSKQVPPVLKSFTLPTEPWGWAIFWKLYYIL